MSNEASPPPPAPTPPTAAEVLRAVAAASPTLWFASEHATQASVPRDQLNEPLLLLKKSGLIHVVDWVKGRGQGYGLTAAGREVMASDAKLTSLREGKLPDTNPEPEDPDLLVRPDPPAAPVEEEHPRTLTRYERGEQAREAFFDPKPAILSPILLALTVLWFLVGVYLTSGDSLTMKEYLRGADSGTAVKLGAAFGPRLVIDGEWWRLLSNCFVHFGVLHLAMNMTALAMLGPFAESLFGRWRFLAVYVFAGIVGSMAAVANGPDSAIAGASGAIWGVTFGIVGWILRYREHLDPRYVADALRRLGYAILINAAISLVPQVSWEAHFAGGAAGLLSFAMLDMIRRDRGRRRLLLGIVGMIVLVVACVGAFVAALRYSEKWDEIRKARQLPFVLRDEIQLLQKVFPVSLPVVEQLHSAATIAMIGQTPNGQKEATEAVDRIEQQAGELSQSLPDRFHPYLDAVRVYCQALRPLLAAKRVPDVEQTRALSAKLDDLQKAWATATNRGK